MYEQRVLNTDARTLVQTKLATQYTLVYIVMQSIKI